MEKEFKEFCSHVRELRAGVPAGRAFPEGVKAEILEWAERKHPDDVAKGAGVARVTISRWRRERAHLKCVEKYDGRYRYGSTTGKYFSCNTGVGSGPRKTGSANVSGLGATFPWECIG